MASVQKRPPRTAGGSATYRVRYCDPAGVQRSKTFDKLSQAKSFQAFGGGDVPIAAFSFGAEESPGRARVMSMRIEDLNFSVRTINCLKKEGITTVGELARLSEDELLRLRNFGRKSLTEVREKLTELGIPLERGAGGPEDEDLADRLGDLEEEEVD